MLSGQRPWSEIHDDTSVVLCLAQGRKPERPKSRSIDEPHWQFINICWSPIQEQRPTSTQIVSTIEQFLDQLSPAQPVRDLIASLSRHRYPHASYALHASTLNGWEHVGIRNSDIQGDYHRSEDSNGLGRWSYILCWSKVDFKRHYSGRLEDLGDTAMSAERHDDAIALYSTALSLNPSVPQRLFLKRSKAYVAMGSWLEALDDADKVRS